jgi:hypothetical protein
MKEMEDLEKALTIINNSDYQVSNVERFSSLYFYLNTIKKKIEEVEKQVRHKGFAMMADMDIKSLDYENYEIKLINPTETESYSASSVIEALGMDRAIAFLKVESSITEYLKKASACGAVTMQEVGACRVGLTKKPKIGYLKIQRKKDLTK